MVTASTIGTRHRPYEGTDDRTVLGGLRRRDEDALEEVHRRHGASVANAIGRVLRSRADVEDILQEVFTNLWLDPEAFQPGRGSLGAFLATVARRRAIDRVRSDSARTRREANELGIAAVDDRVGTAVESRAVGVEVRAALDRLPASEQVAIRLAYFAGHSYRDVASLLGEPEGTVKSRIRAGFTRLRSTTSLVGLQLAV